MPATTPRQRSPATPTTPRRTRELVRDEIQVGIALTPSPPQHCATSAANADPNAAAAAAAAAIAPPDEPEDDD